MANHKSAQKRIRSNERKRVRNKTTLAGMRTAVKKFRQATEAEGQKEGLEKLFVDAQSALGRAAKKGVIHRNTASRSIGKLARLLARTLKPAG